MGSAVLHCSESRSVDWDSAWKMSADSKDIHLV
jgi:hypothetical protein